MLDHLVLKFQTVVVERPHVAHRVLSWNVKTSRVLTKGDGLKTAGCTDLIYPYHHQQLNLEIWGWQINRVKAPGAKLDNLRLSPGIKREGEGGN